VLRYLAQRVAGMVPLVLGTTLLVFVLGRLAVLLGGRAHGYDHQRIAREDWLSFRPRQLLQPDTARLHARLLAVIAAILPLHLPRGQTVCDATHDPLACRLRRGGLSSAFELATPPYRPARS
jgi:hypothetical protein